MPDAWRNRRFFVCCGPPKSGTTMLQRTLDLHPEVSCPSEHQLGFLLSAIKRSMHDYNKVLAVVDKRTGSQGARLIQDRTIMQIFRGIVYRIARDSADNKKIFGLNDNSILVDIKTNHKLLGFPKMIVIFRHPLNVAMSAWRHNHRLAELENNEVHINIMKRHGDIGDWIDFIAKNFLKKVNSVVNYSQGRKDILFFKYEDFIQHKERTVSDAFEFLGAETDEMRLAEILEKSSFEAMRKTAGDRAFYHSGGQDYEAPEGAIERVEAIAGSAMRRLGYDLSTVDEKH